MMKRFLFLTAALALLTASCGAAVNPRDTLTTAMANVRAAETAGAKDNPKAELYLKRATDQIAEAKKKIAEGDKEDAQRLAERAAVDAEVAMVLSQAAQERAKAKRAMKRVERLKKGM
ncbi:MAG: DUF4398 domain-containing protein [Myxococcales bacterium]|nr:DUF4398 domain-containing protein [Myxococcales bacterium]